MNRGGVLQRPYYTVFNFSIPRAAKTSVVFGSSQTLPCSARWNEKAAPSIGNRHCFCKCDRYLNKKLTQSVGNLHQRQLSGMFKTEKVAGQSENHITAVLNRLCYGMLPWHLLEMPLIISNFYQVRWKEEQIWKTPVFIIKGLGRGRKTGDTPIISNVYFSCCICSSSYLC